MAVVRHRPEIRKYVLRLFIRPSRIRFHLLRRDEVEQISASLLAQKLIRDRACCGLPDIRLLRECQAFDQNRRFSVHLGRVYRYVSASGEGQRITCLG